MANRYIYNEILQGAVDGVNKDFTTQHPIAIIEEVFYGGAAYRDITFSGNVVTFQDAPLAGTANPTIDYFYEGPDTPIVTSDVTFGEIIDDVYDKIGEDRYILPEGDVVMFYVESVSDGVQYGMSTSSGGTENIVYTAGPTDGVVDVINGIQSAVPSRFKTDVATVKIAGVNRRTLFIWSDQYPNISMTLNGVGKLQTTSYKNAQLLLGKSLDTIIGIPNRVYRETQIKKGINNGLARIRNQRLYQDLVLQYSFNKARDGNAIGYNANKIVIGDRNFVPASGKLLLGRDVIVDYATFVNGEFGAQAGVTYINGDRVSIGYKIPSEVKKISEVSMDGYILEYKDIREYSIGQLNYTIYKDTNGDRYLFLPYSDERIVTVRYQHNYGILELDEDIVNIERDYFELLSYYCLSMLFKYREDDRWQFAQRDYEDMLRQYKSYKSRATDGINNTIKTTVLTFI